MVDPGGFNRRDGLVVKDRGILVIMAAGNNFRSLVQLSEVCGCLPASMGESVVDDQSGINPRPRFNSLVILFCGGGRCLAHFHSADFDFAKNRQNFQPKFEFSLGRADFFPNPQSFELGGVNFQRPDLRTAERD